MLKFSKKPEMIAGGCSFTDANWQSDIDPHLCHDFPRWPSVLADHLGVTCNNLGKSGDGNVDIANAIFDELERNDNVKYVFVLWSSYDRFSTSKKNHIPIAITHRYFDDSHTSNLKNRDSYKYLIDFYDKYLGDWWSWEVAYDNNHRAMYQVQRECERRNIKYIFAQGPDPWAAGAVTDLINQGVLNRITWTPRLLYKFMDSQYYDKLNEKNFIDWPGLPEIGGNSMSRHEDFRERLRFSEHDGHPSKEGHEWIAQKFLEAHNEIY